MVIKKQRVFAWITILIGVVAVTTLVFSQVSFAVPQTFTVTNTNDSGAGSLRQAIIDANNNGNPADMDIIEFNIPSGDVHTISVSSGLPHITEKVTIDGYTQPGSAVNTNTSPLPLNSEIKIEIDGSGFDGSGAGAHNAAGLYIDANEVVVKGLSVFGFGTTDGITVENELVGIANNRSSIEISGNYIGVRADGMTLGLGNNYSGIVFSDNSINNIIGGENPADRNIVAHSASVQASGAIAGGSPGTVVYGNYIGIAKDGITDLTPVDADANGVNPPFTFGLNITGDGGVTVGGSTSGRKNVISGNMINVLSSSGDNKIQGNIIGSDYLGIVRSAITNGIGISTVGGSGNLIGGTGAGEGNMIAGTKGAGIMVQSFTIPSIPFTIDAQKTAILGNTIKDIKVFGLNSFGSTNLGIDLAIVSDTSVPPDFFPDEFYNYGPTENDAGDVDTGPNNFMNRPVLKTAQQVGSNINVNFDLDNTDSTNGNYRVEFFANAKSTIFGTGPGEIYLGSTSVTSGTGKTASIPVGADYTDKVLSATVTAVDNTTTSGFGGTSEFSQNITIGTESDFDSDGISDVEEDQSPNSGDSNRDGIPDSDQPLVTSFKNKVQSSWITLVVTGCDSNELVKSEAEGDLNAQDGSYKYPFGMTGFKLRCSLGDTANVTMYVYSPDPATGYQARKYSVANKKYAQITGSTITKEVLGADSVLKLAYSVQDGSQYDDDMEANGIIIDPVGLALADNGTLVETGLVSTIFATIALVLIVLAMYTYFDYRKHKKPVIEENPDLASYYTYWHHLKVVSIPLMKYRLRIVIEKRQSFKKGTQA